MMLLKPRVMSWPFFVFVPHILESPVRSILLMTSVIFSLRIIVIPSSAPWVRSMVNSSSIVSALSPFHRTIEAVPPVGAILDDHWRFLLILSYKLLISHRSWSVSSSFVVWWVIPTSSIIIALLSTPILRRRPLFIALVGWVWSVIFSPIFWVSYVVDPMTIISSRMVVVFIYHFTILLTVLVIRLMPERVLLPYRRVSWWSPTDNHILFNQSRSIGQQ